MGSDEVSAVPRPRVKWCAKEDAVRDVGVPRTGVRGIIGGKDDKVVSTVPRGEGAILTVTQNGYVEAYRSGRVPDRLVRRRRYPRATERNGSAVGAAYR